MPEALACALQQAPAGLDALQPHRVEVFGEPDVPAAGEAREDMLAAEVPVALVFNGISHAVMMATPQDLEAFALGFAISEGILASAVDCRGIELRQGQASHGLPAVEVHLEISARCFAQLKWRRRSLAGRTGCGVCGIESLAALELVPPALPAAPWLARVDAPAVLHALSGLPAWQKLNAQAGAIHAAGWAGLDGALTDVMEDVGRHNALDKLLGTLARVGRLRAPGFVVMSSRASHELVAKCARAGVSALATISAPTALGVRAAELAGLRLWGLCRAPRAVRYTR